MFNTQSRSHHGPSFAGPTIGADSRDNQYIGSGGMVYHFSRLQEGLLIDCGAIGNCTGDEPLNLHDKKAAAFGLGPSERIPR